VKKCAKCGSEYEDAYDGCPKCARKPSPSRIIIGIPLVMLWLCCVFIYLSGK
jgi:uncharacterized membrane protein YvbJ